MYSGDRMVSESMTVTMIESGCGEGGRGCRSGWVSGAATLNLKVKELKENIHGVCFMPVRSCDEDSWTSESWNQNTKEREKPTVREPYRNTPPPYGVGAA